MDYWVLLFSLFSLLLPRWLGESSFVKDGVGEDYLEHRQTHRTDIMKNYTSEDNGFEDLLPRGRLLLPISNRLNQKAAMQAWARSLTPKDYDNEHWPKIAGEKSGPPQYFDFYLLRLSEIFAQNNANVNFISIGACDGTNDLTIKRFIANRHWHAMFIEPVSINYAALERFLAEKKVSERSFPLKAAATDLCSTPTIKIQRPLYEEKGAKEGKEVPHWLRRQIGGILPEGKTTARSEWVIEEVKCVTARDAMNEWANAPAVSGERGEPFRRRPHVLKLDVEGHDYEVMMGFLQENTPASELPLLISFEAKSLGDTKFKMAKIRMQALGYAVAKFANDGFALLRGDRMFGKATLIDAAFVSTTTGSGGHGGGSQQRYVDTSSPDTSSVIAEVPTTDAEKSTVDILGPPEDMEEPQ